jgi:hypothetical protein
MLIQAMTIIRLTDIKLKKKYLYNLAIELREAVTLNSPAIFPTAIDLIQLRI